MYTFSVQPDDGEAFEVKADSRDVLAWERKTKQTTRYLLDKLPMLELYRIAHLAATRTGVFDGDLAQFESTCALKLKEEPDDVDPTQLDHTTEG